VRIVALVENFTLARAMLLSTCWGEPSAPITTRWERANCVESRWVPMRRATCGSPVSSAAAANSAIFWS